jgi:hypothetical protein
MIATIIISILYLAALPIVLIMLPGISKEMGWSRVSLLTFFRIWLLMPVFMIWYTFKN